MRSAFCIYRNRDFLQYYYVERFPSFDRLEGRLCVKYHGFTIPLTDAIFSVDFEVSQKNEMTFGIYAPVQAKRENFMFGYHFGDRGQCGDLLTPRRSRCTTELPACSEGASEGVTTLEENDSSIPVEARQF